MPRRKGQYSKTIVAPQRRIADRNPVGGVALGSRLPTTVPGGYKKRPVPGPYKGHRLGARRR